MERQGKKPNSNRCDERNMRIRKEIDFHRRNGLTVRESTQMLSVKYSLSVLYVRDIYYS